MPLAHRMIVASAGTRLAIGSERVAQLLRRHRGEHVVDALQRLRGVARGEDRRVDRDAWQVAGVFAALADRLDGSGIARPKPDLMSGAPHGDGQRRAPGAAAEHGDLALVVHVKDHALAPRRPEPTSG